jgi:hypothetical protein
VTVVGVPSVTSGVTVKLTCGRVIFRSDPNIFSQPD